VLKNRKLRAFLCRYQSVIYEMYFIILTVVLQVFPVGNNVTHKNGSLERLQHSIEWKTDAIVLKSVWL
jgi:hypothetical protein